MTVLNRLADQVVHLRGGDADVRKRSLRRRRGQQHLGIDIRRVCFGAGRVPILDQDPQGLADLGGGDFTSYFLLEAHGLAKAGRRAVVVVLHITQDSAQVVVGLGELRVERDGLTKAGDGLAHLALAIQDYKKAFECGQKPTGAVQLRLSQIEVMLGRPNEALVRLDAMERAGMSGPNCEMLAVSVLRSQKKPEAAAARLSQAFGAPARNTG